MLSMLSRRRFLRGLGATAAVSRVFTLALDSTSPVTVLIELPKVLEHQCPALRPRIGTYLGWAIELDSTDHPEGLLGTSAPWRITVYRDEPDPELIDLGVNVGTRDEAEALAMAWVARVADGLNPS